MKTGKQLYDLGITRIGCQYKLGVVVPKNDFAYKNAFDCAEFASWLVYQVGEILYGCDTSDTSRAKTADAYTGFWARDAKSKGRIISVKEAIATKGAFLLRVGVDKTIGHIVCSDGKGGTIEAHSTAKGVGRFSTDNRRFDMGILIPGFDYDAPDYGYNSAKPTGVVYRYTVPLMAKSDVVKRIQQALIDKGYVLGTSGADGLFGEATMKAVAKFQEKNSLTVDGEVYTATAKALNIKL